MNTSTVDQARSGIANENLQEILDAAVSVAHATTGGQQQYETPPWLAAGLVAQLVHEMPSFAFDPQCASGNLLNSLAYVDRFGWDIDNRFASEQVHGKHISRVTGNCVKLAGIMDELYPELRFPSIVANPPFAIRWKQADDTTIDSTLWTWNLIKQRLAKYGNGYLISSWSTIERMQLHLDPWCYLYQKFPAGIWPNTNVEIGVVHFYNFGTSACPFLRREHTWASLPEPIDFLKVRNRFTALRPAYSSSPTEEWDNIASAWRDDTGRVPKFNIYLAGDGILRTYLSTRAKVKFTRDDILRLSKIDNCHPLTLTTERESRKLLNLLLSRGIYTIEPEARDAILNALAQVTSLSCPIMPVTDFELVAYFAEEEESRCTKLDPTGRLSLTVGKCYPVSTGAYTFRDRFTRKKPHFDEKTEKTSLVDHTCELSGSDHYIQIVDDRGARHRFMDRPNPKATGAGNYYEWHESRLWEFFAEPIVPTVADACEALYERNLAIMDLYAKLNGFAYYEGQLDYVARMGCKASGTIAADVGCGKTPMALTMIQLKSAHRTLIVAPQGTMRSSEGEEEGEEYKASQWVQEIQRFASSEPVFQLFNPEDLEAILRANGGKLPAGIYITYPQAYFSNNALESIPAAWTKEDEHEEKFCKRTGLIFDKDRPVDDWYCKGVGTHNDTGIRCIAYPSLATVVASRFGEPWDMLILDEGHLICHGDAQITKNLLRVQPKYRYIMTATPIPNVVTNLFTIMGWVCVPNWYLGGRRNAAWPYSVDEVSRFESTFLSIEVDITAQEAAKADGKKGWANVGVKRSPIISSPARLLKLLKPSMAYISKERCNPALQPCEVIDVRVDMGEQQEKLYAHWVNRANYLNEYKSLLTIARVQSNRLRGICAAPTEMDYNRFYTGTFDAEGKAIWGKVRSNFNPKTATILQLSHQCLAKGEQVVIASARVGQSNELARRFSEAGIEIARIDSSISADMHTAEANRFKRGDARIMLMGIKCAQGHSFDLCPNLIIGSLEWSYGTMHQAKGRVWRLTSRKPVKVWVVLHKGTIEELLFDRVATKQDAATLCLHGKRVPREFTTLSAEEVLAEHIVDYVPGKAINEHAIEDDWPELKRRLSLVSEAHRA
jgi:SNF2 family DNA or RNA helicase